MTTADRDHQPVIILGAARSGTKLLRSLIAATGRFAEVPFDVNYIWRYGNENWPHDALPLSIQNGQTRNFIRGQLARCARVNAHSSIDRPFVEKTVSNILRVPFVLGVFPQAKYVTIIRDGRDVVKSAARCWRERPNTGYLLAKARAFPWRHCAPYAWQYAAMSARRWLGWDKQIRSWGPRYPGIDHDAARLSLIEVCALQWTASMEHYDRSRQLFASDQLLELRYEDLVMDAQYHVHRLCEFLRVDSRQPVLNFAERTIRTERVSSQRHLPPHDLHRVLCIAGNTLERWGYSSHRSGSEPLAA